MLDETVLQKFYEVLKISDRKDDFENWFEYFVLDSDQQVRLNYCELTRANMITDKCLSAWQSR